ncbi:PD-(D/E)XK nuclease family protein, partial [Peptostreptococcus russellii]
VNVRWIMRFMRSGIFKEILEAEKNDRLYKEKAINYSLRMNSIYKDEDIDESERIMMVGIMDLFYEDKDGNLVLLDYKTDYVANGDYSTIVERYKIQLNMYGNAMEKISGRKVVKKYLYMFSTGKLLDITEE